MGHKQILSQRVANDLVEMITIEKRFQIGDKLPNENELCQELGVSRTTLREAIRSLVAHNILEIRRGKGTFVANNGDLDIDYGYGELEHILPKTRDIYEIRLMLEPPMTALATERATDEEIKNIVRYGELAGEKLRNNQDYFKEEQQFHNAIAKATHNDFMMRMVPIINRGLLGGIRSGKNTDEIKEQSLTNRMLLLKFVQNRDAHGAEVAMRMHIMLGMLKIENTDPEDE